MTYFLTVQDFDNKFIHKNKPLKSLDDALAMISPRYLPLSEGKLTSLAQRPLSDPQAGHCQTNLNRPAKGAGPRRSGRQLTPLGQGGGTVLSEDVAAIEVTVLIEMIMDRGVGGGKLLQSLYVPELRHRHLPSSERLV